MNAERLAGIASNTDPSNANLAEFRLRIHAARGLELLVLSIVDPSNSAQYLTSVVGAFDDSAFESPTAAIISALGQAHYSLLQSSRDPSQSLQALRRLQSILKQHPDCVSPDVKLWLGRVLSVIGRQGLAKIALEEALDAQPDLQPAIASLIRQNADKAKTLFGARQAVKNVKELVVAIKDSGAASPSAILTLVDILFSVGRVDESKDLLAAHFGLRTTPQTDMMLPKAIREELFWQRSRFHQLIGEFDSALKNLQAIPPRGASSDFARAQIMLKQSLEGNFDAAVKCLETCEAGLAKCKAVTPAVSRLVAVAAYCVANHARTNLAQKDHAMRIAIDHIERVVSHPASATHDMHLLAARAHELSGKGDWQVIALGHLERAKSLLEREGKPVPLELENNMSALMSSVGQLTISAESNERALLLVQSKLKDMSLKWNLTSCDMVEEEERKRELHKVRCQYVILLFNKAIAQQNMSKLRECNSTLEEVQKLAPSFEGPLLLQIAQSNERGTPFKSSKIDKFLGSLPKNSKLPVELLHARLDFVKQNNGYTEFDKNIKTYLNNSDFVNHPRTLAAYGLMEYFRLRSASADPRKTKEKWDSAHGIFLQSIHTQRNSIVALSGLAALAAERGELQTAIHLWREALSGVSSNNSTSTAIVQQDHVGIEASLNTNLGHALHMMAMQQTGFPKDVLFWSEGGGDSSDVNSLDMSLAMRSEKHYLASMRIRPNDRQTLLGYALLRGRMYGASEAIKILEIASRRFPWDIRFKWNIAHLTLQMDSSVFQKSFRIFETEYANSMRHWKEIDDLNWEHERLTLVFNTRKAKFEEETVMAQQLIADNVDEHGNLPPGFVLPVVMPFIDPFDEEKKNHLRTKTPKQAIEHDTFDIKFWEASISRLRSVLRTLETLSQQLNDDRRIDLAYHRKLSLLNEGYSSKQNREAISSSELLRIVDRCEKLLGAGRSSDFEELFKTLPESFLGVGRIPMITVVGGWNGKGIGPCDSMCSLAELPEMTTVKKDAHQLKVRLNDLEESRMTIISAKIAENNNIRSVSQQLLKEAEEQKRVERLRIKKRILARRKEEVEASRRLAIIAGDIGNSVAQQGEDETTATGRRRSTKGGAGDATGSRQKSFGKKSRKTSTKNKKGKKKTKKGDDADEEEGDSVRSFESESEDESNYEEDGEFIVKSDGEEGEGENKGALSEGNSEDWSEDDGNGEKEFEMSDNDDNEVAEAHESSKAERKKRSDKKGDKKNDKKRKKDKKKKEKIDFSRDGGDENDIFEDTSIAEKRQMNSEEPDATSNKKRRRFLEQDDDDDDIFGDNGGDLFDAELVSDPSKDVTAHLNEASGDEGEEPKEDSRKRFLDEDE